MTKLDRRALDVYWGIRLRGYGEADPDDALQSVMYRAAPGWFNRALHWVQASLLSDLLRQVEGEGAPVLEVGCGTGRITQLLQAKGMRVAAVDLRPEAMRITLSTNAAAALALVELPFLPFRTGVFHGAISVSVLQHLEWPRQGEALAELVRVVRPGGWLLLMESIVSGDAAAHVFGRDLAAWLDLFAANDLKLVRAHGHQFIPRLCLVTGLHLSSVKQPSGTGRPPPARPRTAGRPRRWRSTIIALMVRPIAIVERTASMRLPASWGAQVAWLLQRQG